MVRPVNSDNSARTRSIHRCAAIHRPMDLAGFNQAPATDVEAALLDCCASPQWARLVAAGRPYASADALFAAADAAVADLDDGGLAAALAGHPRIGERAGAGHPASSGREQAGVA